MRLLIAALLSAGLISAAPIQTPPVNKVDSRIQIRAVQAVQVSEVQKTSQQAPTDPQAITTTGAVTQSGNEPDATPQTQVTQASGCEAYRNIIAQYSWNVDVAIEVCNAESSGNPTNDNPTDYHATCMGSRGLFQIGCDSTDNYAGMFDPSANIAQAFSLYAARGWQPWGATTCAYKVVCY